MEFPASHGRLETRPALAAGNTCVLKPAKTTSITALHLAEIFPAGGAARQCG